MESCDLKWSLYCKDKFEDLDGRMREKTKFMMEERTARAELKKDIDFLKKQSEDNKNELNKKIDALREDMDEHINEVKDGLKKNNALLVTMLVSIVLAVIGLLIGKII